MRGVFSGADDKRPDLPTFLALNRELNYRTLPKKWGHGGE
jgi:hypothetical protein